MSYDSCMYSQLLASLHHLPICDASISARLTVAIYGLDTHSNWLLFII